MREIVQMKLKKEVCTSLETWIGTVLWILLQQLVYLNTMHLCVSTFLLSW